MNAGPITLAAIAVDALDPEALARFWGTLLEREQVDDPHGDATLQADRSGGVRIRFVEAPEPKTRQNRIHFDLTTMSAADQAATIELALDLGGRHVDVGQSPQERHVVLGDPEGNEFCVVAPDNRFLAGCGRLGAVNCDGTRVVGQFWSDVLGWPLVWDQDEETAIQSPLGGSKVTWSGPPLMPRVGRDRLRFDLAALMPPEAAIDRLRSAGALLTVQDRDEARFVDPDGNEFRLLAV